MDIDFSLAVNIHVNRTEGRHNRDKIKYKIICLVLYYVLYDVSRTVSKLHICDLWSSMSNELNGSQKQMQLRDDPALRCQQGTERMAGNGVMDDQDREQMAGDGRGNRTYVRDHGVDRSSRRRRHASVYWDIPVKPIHLLQVFFCDG